MATAKDVLAAIAAIGLPTPTRPALEAISANCRDTFLSALRMCVMKRDADGSQRAYLENVLACLDGSIADTLKSIRLDVEPSDLIKIASFRPARFRSAVAIAQNPAHARHAEAVQFLRQFIASKEWLAAEPAAASAHPQTMYDIPGMPPDPHSQETPAAPAPLPRRMETAQNVPQSSAPAQQTAPAARSVARPAPSCDAPKPGAQTDNRAQSFRSHHVYGADYALCFNAASSQDGTPTIMVDAAAANGQRSYDWKNAIHIMLDPREVACVFAVLRKWRTQVEFTAHGKRNDKSFSLAWQGPHFFCKIAAKIDSKPVRAVKIMPLDSIQVGILFLEQLLLAYPGVPATEVLELTRSVNTIDDRRASNQ